ncbi:hypothetical protein [Streptomyces sp. MAR4 CNX-425]|uniref:hypothetical protein n=1 Tax=Streptomyces sp. MAR4 CNX-425 TaxID=3406343 RepID=UPI003B50B6BD
MHTVYRGELRVGFMQFSVDSRPDPLGRKAWDPRAGQRNGLCGAAVPGHLLLTTGTHTGRVGLTVEVHEAEPPVGKRWEEVVEVSFRPASPRMSLFPWGDGELCAAELAETDHRVRYCARGMDAAADAEAADVEDDLSGANQDQDHDQDHHPAADPKAALADVAPPADHYLLQFWPAPPAPERIVRETSRRAAYWHRVARKLPAPPTPGNLAAAERREREAKEREHEGAHGWAERQRWGGRIPGARVRAVGGNVLMMVELDRDLIDEVDAVGPRAQRDLARWVARRALTAAGLDRIGWIAAGLDAVERGEDLPAPLDDHGRAFRRLFADPEVPETVVDSTDGLRDNVLQQAMALPALLAAADTDPLRAALDALSHAAVTWGSTYPDLFAEVRARLAH